MFFSRTPLCRLGRALFLIALLPLAAAAQPPVLPGTEIPSLLDLSRRFAEELEAGRPARYDEILSLKGGPQGRLNADPDIFFQFLTPRGFPRYVQTHNINAARTISVDDVWPGGGAGFSLAGSGTALGRLAEWDAGGVRLTHQEFDGRVSQIDSPSSTHYHSTHVAGTLIAAGVDPNAKGMSFQGTLAAYDWNDDQSEMAAAAAGGLNVSNHSYGYIAGWYNSSGTWYWYGDVTVSETEDYGFGFYDDLARGWDEIAHDAPYYTIVKSAGNERDDAGPGPGGGHYFYDPDTGDWEWSTATRDADGGTTGFDCVTYNGNAKNVLAIGAVNDIPAGYSAPGDVVAAGFSSWGPTDDGRIKPDFVANGVSLYSTHNGGDNQYATYSGTSMASPNAAGALNLLVRYYEASHGATPRSATMKSILLQTADEAGPAAGPDYMFGWGLVNAKKATQLIQADSSEAGRVREETLANGETDEFTFTLPGAAPVRLSIAWTDPPGTPPAPSIDPPTPMLVNDLDLRLERVGGGTYSPYVLNPANPPAAASTGDNFRDNAEQIFVASAPAGTYLVRITHKGSLASPQAYSIASTHQLTIGAPPAAPIVLASDTSSTHVYVEWNAVAGAESYEVKRDASLLAVVDASVHSWRDTVAAGRYQYEVRAGNVFGWSLPGSDSGTVLPPPAWVDVASGPLAASDSTFGASWGDYDGDGDLDLFLANKGSADRLLRNDGGFFVDATAAPLGGSGAGRGASWGDYDSDGILDLYVANDGPNALYRGLGGGAFADATAGVLGDAGDCRSAPWCDYEGDRRLDLFLVNRGSADRLLRNELPGPFADATAPPLGDAGNGNAAAWGDYDNDGDDDVYLTHEVIGASRLYRNEGLGEFADATAGPLAGDAAGATASWGDYDNDGDLDLFRVGVDPGTSELLRNDGGGVFAAVAGSPTNGATGRSAAWGDVDSDGDLDLSIGCNGPNRLYRNDGGGAFVEIESAILGDVGDARSVSFADYDGDGDLDLLVANAGGPKRLFRNDGAGENNRILVTLQGTASNRSAIGARLRLAAARLVQIREVSGGEGSGQGPLTAEFGLGSIVFADSLTIFWPSGFVQTVPGPMYGGNYIITEDPISTRIADGAPPPMRHRLLPPAPNPFNPTTRISFEVPSAELVNVSIYDVSGRTIVVLADAVCPAGRFELVWDGRDGSGRAAPSGVYFARMTAGSFTDAKRLLLLR